MIDWVGRIYIYVYICMYQYIYICINIHIIIYMYKLAVRAYAPRACSFFILCLQFESLGLVSGVPFIHLIYVLCGGKLSLTRFVYVEVHISLNTRKHLCPGAFVSMCLVYGIYALVSACRQI